MKMKELKNKSDEDLKKDLQAMREKLRNFRFDLEAGKVKDVRGIRQLKKDIARVLTLLNERRLTNAKMNNIK